MTKLRKQRKRKTYRYNINRKRLRNKIHGTGKVACKEVKEAWEVGKSVKSNLANMGLSYDPNKSIKAGKPDHHLKAKGWVEEECEEGFVPSKTFVAEALEKEARAPRERLFRLPKSQVAWITYLMDKYTTNYKAMARDKKNYYQETWKQLRAKIRVFKGIPEQYKKYLQERGLGDVAQTTMAVSDDD